jgi:hypothetical protein
MQFLQLHVTLSLRSKYFPPNPVPRHSQVGLYIIMLNRLILLKRPTLNYILHYYHDVDENSTNGDIFSVQFFRKIGLNFFIG